jgi:hypothetical protein
LKTNRLFGGTYSLQLQGRKINKARSQREAGSNQNSAFNGLHGVITQKIELFITTAERTSNPA